MLRKFIVAILAIVLAGGNAIGMVLPDSILGPVVMAEPDASPCKAGPADDCCDHGNTTPGAACNLNLACGVRCATSLSLLPSPLPQVVQQAERPIALPTCLALKLRPNSPPLRPPRLSILV